MASTRSGGKEIAGQIAEFSANLRFSDLPPDVLQILPSLVLDQLACQVVGSLPAHNALVRDYALDESPAGQSTVIRGPRKARPEWAALANATAGHGFEMDDTHKDALAHPSCVLVPATLAVAEDRAAHGHEALLALALGTEIAVRVGLAVQPSMLTSRGFHETCVMGVFGTAIAAGRLAGLTPPQLAAALGIAGSHASGTIEYGRSGGEVKRLHAGLGAMGGIRAANLAARGLTGPAKIFEGTKGILQAVAVSPKPEAMIAGLGRVWHFTKLCPKEFCAALTIHGPVRALRTILSKHRLDIGKIERIVVGVDEFSAGHLGTLGPRPRDMAGAQFSLHFSLAMSAVLGGAGYREYRQAARDQFAHPDIIRLAEKVTVEVDAEANATFPARMMGVVTLTCADGIVHTERDEAMSFWDFDFVRSRFNDVVAEEYGPGSAETIGKGIDALAEDGPVRGLLEPLMQQGLRKAVA